MAHLAAFHVNNFRTYERRFYHSFGEFLAHYLEFWQRANDHGVTHYEGIMRLLALMPVEWEGWAREQSLFYIFRDPVTTMLVGDFLSFIGVIHFRYITFRHPPPGPYVHVPDYQMLQLPEAEEPIIDPEPVVEPAQEPPIADPAPEPVIDPVQEFLVDLEPEPSVGSASTVASAVAPPLPPEPAPAVPPPPPEQEEPEEPQQMPAADPAPVVEPPPRRRRISASGSFVRVPIHIPSDSDVDLDDTDREASGTEPSDDSSDGSSAGPQAS